MFKCALRIKNGENKNTNCVAKRAKGNDKVKFVYNYFMKKWQGGLKEPRCFSLT